MKRAMIVGLVGVVLALLLVAVVVRLAENSMIYFPPRYPAGFLPAASYPFTYEDVWLTTSDGVRINAWYIAAGSEVSGPRSVVGNEGRETTDHRPRTTDHIAAGSEVSGPRSVVGDVGRETTDHRPRTTNLPSKVLLLFHGNAVNIAQLGQAQLPVMLRTGANILVVDYRGYGRSEGSPDEAGIYRDAEAAWRYLTEVRGHRPEDIFIYGQSLGGAVAVELAARLSVGQASRPAASAPRAEGEDGRPGGLPHCGGLIVESSFTSGRDIARLMFRIPLFAYLPKSRFDSVDAIRRVRCPVLVMHGTEDGVIPFVMGERLHRAANEPKQFWRVEGAGHNDIFITAGSEYVQRLRELLAH